MEGEECADRSEQVGHKIDDDIVHGDADDRERNACKSISYDCSGGAIQAV